MNNYYNLEFRVLDMYQCMCSFALEPNNMHCTLEPNNEGDKTS